MPVSAEAVCNAAFATIERRFEEFSAGRQQSQIVRWLHLPTGNVAETSAHGAYESAQPASCGACEWGLVKVELEGRPARLRCSCSLADRWGERVAAFSSVFDFLPHLLQQQEEPLSTTGGAEPSTAPIWRQEHADGRLTPEQEADLRAMAEHDAWEDRLA